MPDILENQSEALMNAREAAAQGVLSPATILLLADSQNFHGYHKLHWTLRFPLPAPSQTGNIRRFSAAPQRALAGAIRHAAPFNYSAIENTVLQDVPFRSFRISYSALDLYGLLNTVFISSHWRSSDFQCFCF